MNTNPAANPLQRIADQGDLASVFQFLEQHGGYRHLDHWQQGEFHHDHLLEINAAELGLDGSFVVIATTCNGAVKEAILLECEPGRWALWGWRVPENPEFEPGALRVLGHAKTPVWFDERRLLLADTRSEMRPEHRRRQRGGGWVPRDSPEQ